MTQEVVTKEMFTVWRQDPVTKQIMDRLQDLREQIQHGLKDEAIILCDSGQLKLARLLGQRDGLDVLLNIQYDEDEDE